MFTTTVFSSVGPDAAGALLHWFLFAASVLLIVSVGRLQGRVRRAEILFARIADAVEFPEGRPDDDGGGTVIVGSVPVGPVPPAASVDPDEYLNRWRERRAPDGAFFRGGIGQ